MNANFCNAVFLALSFCGRIWCLLLVVTFYVNFLCTWKGVIRKPEKFSRWILVVVKIFSAGCCCIFLSSISLSFQNTPKTDRQDSASVVIDRLDGPDPCLDKPLKCPRQLYPSKNPKWESWWMFLWVCNEAYWFGELCLSFGFRNACMQRQIFVAVKPVIVAAYVLRICDRQWMVGWSVLPRF